MIRPCTRTCPCLPPAAPAMDIEEDDEEDRCVICLDDMNCKESLVALGCGHKFHGQCLVTHLLKDVKCPLCRFSPYASSNYAYSESETSYDSPRVSRTEALKLARADKNKSNGIKRSLNTITKWGKEAKSYLPKIREINSVLNLAEDTVSSKLTAYEKKLVHKFEQPRCRHRVRHQPAVRSHMNEQVGASSGLCCKVSSET